MFAPTKRVDPSGGGPLDGILIDEKIQAIGNMAELLADSIRERLDDEALAGLQISRAGKGVVFLAFPCAMDAQPRFHGLFRKELSRAIGLQADVRGQFSLQNESICPNFPAC